MSLWPSTDAYQCLTPATLSRAYLEELCHTPFPDQLSMQKHPLHTLGISLKYLICGV